MITEFSVNSPDVYLCFVIQCRCLSDLVINFMTFQKPLTFPLLTLVIKVHSNLHDFPDTLQSSVLHLLASHTKFFSTAMLKKVMGGRAQFALFRRLGETRPLLNPQRLHIKTMKILKTRRCLQRSADGCAHVRLIKNLCWKAGNNLTICLAFSFSHCGSVCPKGNAPGAESAYTWRQAQGVRRCKQYQRWTEADLTSWKTIRAYFSIQSHLLNMLLSLILQISLLST